MTTSRRVSAGSVASAVLLIAGLLWVATVAVRTAAVNILPPGDPRAAVLTPRSPDVVLNNALIRWVLAKGKLDAPTLAAVGRTAQRAPLDARPYLFFGAEDILHRDGARATEVLEAGRRLDGRNRWIRLLLLDRYLRAKRYDQAAGELAVLNRLVSGAQTPILGELARMAQDPSTRDAVRQTLARDPALEADLLGTLARLDPDPQLLLGLASPSARAMARLPNGWGQSLVQAMVDRGRFTAARATWARLFGIAPDAAAQPVYDSGFYGLAGAPPFGWQFASGTIGAADPRHGQLSVEYYGRDDGILASQLLVLSPGRYRLGYALAGGAGTGLSWTLSCADQPKAAPFVSVGLPSATAAPHRFGLDFAVPASGCTAQWLRLVGTAAEFPTAVNLTISGLALRKAAP